MAVFVLIIRALSIPLGGMQPEALVLIAMMTAPFTLGVALLATLVAAGPETMVQRLRSVRA